MPSYFTPAEVELLQASPMFAHETIAYRDVSQGMLSVARHYGGAQLPGGSFTYIPATDELIRDDVLKFISKARRTEKQTKSMAAVDSQIALGL